jgi:hypothetical protein
MRHMNNKDNVLHIRLDADLLTDLNDLARRLGDDNTSAAARWAIRAGLEASVNSDALPVLRTKAVPQALEVTYDMGQD